MRGGSPGEDQTDQEAQNYLYRDIPKYYSFCKDKSIWKKTKTPAFKTVGRVYAVHIRDSERFSLRLLLNHVNGAKSFEEL